MKTIKEMYEELKHAIDTYDVQPNSRWRHYKETVYAIAFLSFSEDTNELLVTYCETHQYHNVMFTRPLHEFLEKFSLVRERQLWMTEEEYSTYKKSYPYEMD